MATFVVVHGDRTWRPIQDLVEAAGHQTLAPSLTGYGDRTHLAHPGLQLSDHVEHIVRPILDADLTDVVLAGHSYGGLVITGVAERIANRLRHLVYVDAVAPRDGESALDISAPERREEILELARTDSSWTFHEFPVSHNIQRDAPHELTRVLLGTLAPS